MKKIPFEFNLRAHAKIGEMIALKLPLYLKEMEVVRPAVIVDAHVTPLPYIKKVLKKVKKEFPQAIVWKYDIPGEPDYDSLDLIKEKFLKDRKSLVDACIAIGGGSVIDTAKGLATLIKNPGPARTYRGFPSRLNPSLPVIALPTVAGSGSEVTYNASFIDWKEKKKMGINTFNNFPRLSILDPLLSLECPKEVTISSAMDALVHALESYATPKANELSKLFSKEAVSYILPALSVIAKNPKNKEARLHLQLGAYLAGIAIVQAGGGPASMLSYPLGVHGKVPHGLAGAVFLPYIVEHNIKKGYDYRGLFPQTTIKAKKDANKAIAKKLFSLHVSLGIASLFSRYSLVIENASLIIKEMENMQDGFNATNPVPFSTRDAKKIFSTLLALNFKF